jgi:hypothetical protein
MYPINIVASFIHQKSWEQGYNLVLISAMGFLMDFRPEMRRAGGVRKTGVFSTRAVQQPHLGGAGGSAKDVVSDWQSYGVTPVWDGYARRSL